MKKKKYYLFKLKTGTLNLISLLLMLILVLLVFLFYWEKDFTFTDVDMLLVLILMIPYFMFHEVLHSISYVLHGAKFKNITYGIHLEKGVLCCLCKQNISKKNILISLVYPFFFIGIITLIIGLLFNNFVLIILSIMNISGCSGDLLMFMGLSKIKSFEYSEYDDPISFGLYTTEDLSKKKMVGLEYVDTIDKLKREDLKKVSISKSSIIFMIIYIIILVLDFIVSKID